MSHIASPLFLLSLLACDWAASPQHLPITLRALAGEMASTECFCLSSSHSNTIRQACVPDPHATFRDQPSGEERFAPRPPPGPPIPLPPALGPPRDFLIMSLLR